MRRLIALVVLLSMVLSIHAQVDTIPDDATQPPSVLMLILLDDTLTNILRGESTNTSASTIFPSASLGRSATDPLDARGQAVVNMLTLLQADANITHSVAVLRFATNNEAPEWLTGNPDNPFITLGGGVTVSTAFDDSVSRILNRRDYGIAGPGDTEMALAMGLEAFTTNVNANIGQNSKPIITLITDDVPIDDWGLSPWRTTNTASWQAYADEFETSLQNLASFNAYNGYCAAEAGITLSVFALGAANWVNSNGTVAYSNVEAILPDGLTEGRGDYFPQLLNNLNSRNPRTDVPYLYAIDPEFSDADGQDLYDDLLASSEAFINDVRCSNPVTYTDNDIGFETVYNFEMSAIYDQVLITVDLFSAGSPIPTLVRPDGTPAQVEQFRMNEREIIIRALRDNNPDMWSGDWTLSTSANEAVTLNIQAHLDYAGIEVIPQDAPTSVTQGEEFTYSVLLQDQYGQRIEQDPLIESVLLRVGDNNTFEEMLYDDTTGLYSRIVSAEEIVSEGTYDVEARLAFSQLSLNVPVPIEAQDFELATVSTESQLNLGRAASIGQIACEDGSNEISLPITFDASSNPESIASYMRVEAYYGESETPIAILSWDFANRFVGTIDCSLLESGDSQQFTIIGSLPDNSTPQSRTIAFSFQATATPTPMPSPTVNPLPSPTPIPTGPDYGGNAMRSVTTFPLVIILPILGIIVALLTLVLIYRWYRQHITPLSNVYVEIQSQSETPSREPLLTGFSNYLPLQQRTFSITREIPNEAGEMEPQSISLFTVKGNWGGDALTIRVSAENLRINSTISLPLNTERDFSGQTVTVTYDTEQEIRIYRLINYYGR